MLKFLCFSFGYGFFADNRSSSLCKVVKMNSTLFVGGFGSHRFCCLDHVAFRSSPILRIGAAALAKIPGWFWEGSLVKFISDVRFRVDKARLFHCPRFGKSCFLLVVEPVETQLQKFESCAIIFSRGRAGLAPVRAAGVPWGCPTRRAPDVWESARF